MCRSTMRAAISNAKLKIERFTERHMASISPCAQVQSALLASRSSSSSVILRHSGDVPDCASGKTPQGFE